VNNTTEEASNIGTLVYIAMLGMSRMAVLLKLKVPWGVLRHMFSWLDFFTLPTPPLPHASEATKVGLAVAFAAIAPAAILLRLGVLVVAPRDGWTPRIKPLEGYRWDRSLPAKVLLRVRSRVVVKRDP
jgi:hypothetical protein